MRHRIFLLSLSFIVVAAILALASSLHDVQFQPARPLWTTAAAATPVAAPSLEILSETPLWKLLLFWLVAVLNLCMFILLIPPELRRRIIRQVLSFAVGILMLLIALQNHLIQVPQLSTEPADSVGGVVDGLAGLPHPPVFHPPQMSPWMIYLGSLTAVLILSALAAFVYRRWRLSRTGRHSPLHTIAGIAQASLGDLAAGRAWADVIIESYARMCDAVTARRGLVRGVSATPREFAERLTRAGLPTDAIRKLTGLFESSRYGGRTGSASDVRDAVDCLNVILQACGVAS